MHPWGILGCQSVEWNNGMLQAADADPSSQGQPPSSPAALSDQVQLAQATGCRPHGVSSSNVSAVSGTTQAVQP